MMEVPDKVPERYDRIADIVKKKYDLKVLKYVDEIEKTEPHDVLAVVAVDLVVDDGGHTPCGLSVTHESGTQEIHGIPD